MARRIPRSRDGWTIQDPAGRAVHWDRTKIDAWKGYAAARADGVHWGTLVAEGYRAVPYRLPIEAVPAKRTRARRG